MDRFTQYAVAAAKMAVADAKLEITEENGPRIGVWIGSGIGGMETYEEQFKIFTEKGPRREPILRADDDSGYGKEVKYQSQQEQKELTLVL